MHSHEWNQRRNASLTGKSQCPSIEPEGHLKGSDESLDMSATPRAPPMDRIIREAECHAITSLSRTSRWRMERAGQFPKRRQIGPGCVGWLASELAAWLASRREAA
jgi:prophage regulatory protein